VLAEALATELAARGVRAELDREIAHGWLVAVHGPNWEHWGGLNVYWGRKGPNISTHFLTGLVDEGARGLIDAAISAAFRKAGAPERIPLAPTAPPPKGTTEVWVDGAFIRNGARVAVGWAFVVVRGGHEIHAESGSDVPPGSEKHWNIAGEAVAVVRALAWCREQGLLSVIICHDYVGLAAWPQGRYKAKLPFTKWYRSEVRGSGIEVHWKKVKAHSGIPWNERADALATGAARAALGGR